MSNLHEHYDQLTETERERLDNAMRCATDYLIRQNMPFDGSDQIERAVDALALAIINARPPEPTKDAKTIEAISDRPRGSRIADLLAELTDAGLNNAAELAIITPHEYLTEKRRRDAEAMATFDGDDATICDDITNGLPDKEPDTGFPDSTTDERARASVASPVPPGTQYSRDEAITAIRDALKARGMRYSVKGGRGTSWGWIEVDILPAVDKTLDDAGRKAAYRALGEAFGMDRGGYSSISIPASSAHYREYIERARGLKPTKIAEAYWD